MAPALLLWQQPGWPALRYGGAQAAAQVAAARRAQGLVEGKLTAIGFELRQTLAAEAWTQDAMATAAIEGERLDLETVRSSVARRLGVAQAKAAITPRPVDGLLDVMDDAVARAQATLTHERVQSWQAALFPSGYSGLTRLRVGGYREHAEPMLIVSGRSGREKVHYEAPPTSKVHQEMDHFLNWLEQPGNDDNLVKAALAHLWFETIHPFEDGNGRVGRAIVDLVLARDARGAGGSGGSGHSGHSGHLGHWDDTSRLLRLSQQLLAKRAEYYEHLERAQHGPLDVTPWVVWFVAQVGAACAAAAEVIDMSLAKARFWNEHRDKNLHPRQRKAVNALLDAGPQGFEGGMSTRKYENLTGASRATASRDLLELAELGMLVQLGAGRGTRYELRLSGASGAGAEATPRR